MKNIVKFSVKNWIWKTSTEKFYLLFFSYIIAIDDIYILQMKNNQNLFVVKKFNEPGKNNKQKWIRYKERGYKWKKDLIISGNIIFNENADFVNKSKCSW